MMKLFYVFCLIIFSTNCLVIAINVCQSASNCSQCISLSPKCSWCEIHAYISTSTSRYYKKCDLLTAHQLQGCKKIHNPKSTTTITEDAVLQGDTRVRPKKVTVTVRPGQPAEIKVHVKTPLNFPIDLYILMDLSRSMADDVKQIVGLADSLTNEMNRVSSNFRLGFGGFIDKPIGPYTFTSAGEIRSMGEMPYTFSYKNFQQLTQNTKIFKDTVYRDVKASFNVDAPEGSLEALMQVIRCPEAIGWRDKRKARRLVIVTTDQLIHLSGDGLMVGAVVPNDGNCHLTDGYQYTAYDKFDYPSLSQVREAVIESQIVPIFAVLGHEHLYEDVASFFGLTSGAVSDRLANDSSNIVPIVKNAYEKIARTVRIKSSAPAGIDVKFLSNCGKKGEPITEKTLCDGIELGQEIQFTTTVLANDCKADTSFQIKTDFDDIDVKLDIVCDCPCEQIKEYNSSSCSDRGTSSCGLCACNEGFAGRNCQCTTVEAENKTLCLKDGSVCNDQGTCECGECKCDAISYNDAKGTYEYIYGDQCECTNTTCPRSNGQICGGPAHGKCDCGKCQCLAGWTGIACGQDCPWAQNNCADDSVVGSINGKKIMCGGHGTCKCNKCVCHEGYGGDYCQRCFYNCPNPCEEFKECAKCLAFDSSDLTQEQCHQLCRSLNISLDFKMVDMIDKDERCIARDEDDCSIIFTNNQKFHHDHDHVLVIRRTRLCPAEADIMAVILGVIAAIVGIGLILLFIWRILATLQDRKELAKFEDRNGDQKWHTLGNPIYVEATSTFENPTYGQPPSSPTPSTYNPANFEGT